MAAQFKTWVISGHSTLHMIIFLANGREYELSLQSISRVNTFDSSVDFPDNYTFSTAGCWEITFDLVENMLNKTPFEPLVTSMNSAINVIRIIERFIAAHYTEHHPGMYVFSPVNDRLGTIYRQVLRKRPGRGFTLEIGLDPQRRGYVLRTPKCYQSQKS